MNLGFRYVLVSLALASTLPGCTLVAAASKPGHGNTADTDAGSDDFSGGGTFTATGADAGGDSAMLSGIDMTLAAFLTSTNVYQLSMAATFGDGKSSAAFSGPGSVGTYTLTSSVVFSGAPTTGMTLTGSNSCGATTFSYGPTAKPFEYSFGASMQGASCSTVSGSNAGSWTLTFTSVSSPGGDLGNSYTAHGTFKATMPDGMGGTGTLDLTF